MNDILIHNARTCVDDKIVVSDLLIKNGLINRIAEHIENKGDFEVVDAKGQYLLPGFIDIHTHLDDKIGEYLLADDYQSGSRIALLNGITTLYSFVTQSSGANISKCIETARNKAKGKSFSNIGWHITPTNFDESSIDEIRDLIQKGFKTIKLYTTYKEAGIFSSYEQIKMISEAFKDLNITVLVHCEDETELNKIDATEVSSSKPYSHSIVRTKTSEIKAVENIINIARETGVHFHIVHVSTPEVVELITDAKSEVNITCETGPQYLYLNNSSLNELDGFKYLCTPPLRDEKSRQELLTLATAGKIDLFATDHCAFSVKDKSEHRNNYSLVPKGIPGIGALVPMTFEILKSKGDAGIIEMAKKLSENPARLINKYPSKGCIKEGSDADLVLFNVDGPKRNIHSSLSEVYDPYENFSTEINIAAVFLKGELMTKENTFVYSGNPKGELL